MLFRSLLQAAYELDPRSETTLYNFAYVLKEAGERRLALVYAEKIENPDEASRLLIAELRREDM